MGWRSNVNSQAHIQTTNTGRLAQNNVPSSNVVGPYPLVTVSGCVHKQKHCAGGVSAQVLPVIHSKFVVLICWLKNFRVGQDPEGAGSGGGGVAPTRPPGRMGFRKLAAAVATGRCPDPMIV